MNIGFHTARLNNLVRQLNEITASSFAKQGDVYFLVTDILIEANHLRELLKNQQGLIKDVGAAND
jgi:hypothetical protein